MYTPKKAANLARITVQEVEDLMLLGQVENTDGYITPAGLEQLNAYREKTYRTEKATLSKAVRSRQRS